jgi:hypothetical protein
MEKKKENGSAWLILPLLAISIYDDREEIMFGWLNWTRTFVIS